MFRNGIMPSDLLRRNVLRDADNGAGGGGGSNPPPPAGNGDNGTPPAGLTEEQWRLAFEHPRFKELSKRAKEAETALAKQEADRQAAEEARLKEQNDFKALWEKAETDRKAALAEAERIRGERVADLKRTAIQAAAAKANFHPKAAEDAHRFIDLATLPVNDAGAVDAAAVNKAVEALGKEHPYMLGNGQRQDAGSPPAHNQQNQPRPQPNTGRPLTL